MKRLVGMMILASVPIGCGVQTASTPDAATAPPTSESGSVSALARSRGPACVRGDRSKIRSIELVVVNQGRGFVTVRAVIGSSPAETYPPVCLSPWWVVNPVVRTDPYTDPEQVVIYGPPGKYHVTGFTQVTEWTRLSASKAVTIE
jgi:hypothetical protein